MSKETTSSSSKSSHTGLFSVTGVLAVAGILIGVNYLARGVHTQIDFTENKFYSLTDGTRSILGDVDTPVEATLFVSEGRDLPPELVSRVTDVEALLRQYESNAPKGMFSYRKLVPKPDTEAAEKAALAGVQAQPTRGGGDAVLTLSVTCLDKRENVDFLPLMGREEQFEYEVSRAISNVLKGDKKKKIGLMSALPINGSPMGPMMGGQQRPWVVAQQLKRDYDVVNVELTADKIDDALDALLVVHPAGITDTAQFAIDQFILKGKPTVIMLDPASLVAKNSQRQQNPQMPMMGGANASSSVPKLTAEWGYTFDASQVVADMSYQTPLRGNQMSPVFLTLGQKAINDKDPVTLGLTDALFVHTGAFTGKPADGLTEDILIKTSPKNELISAMEADGDPEALVRKFKSSDKEKILALRLSGKFKTAFPDGKPKKEDKPDEPKAEEKKDEEKKDEEKKDEEKKDDAAPLKEMAEGKSGVVILVADTDFMFDAFSVQMLGPQMAMPFNGNLPLAMNIVDQVAGDTRLVQIRSRGPNRRPFTKINDIQVAAEERIKDEVARLQEKADEANKKLSELQAAKDPKQQNFLSPEQQAQIDEFRQEQVNASKQIRELRKGARAEIDSKLARLKALNIGIVPGLIAVIGLTVYIVRRIATSAK